MNPDALYARNDLTIAPAGLGHSLVTLATQGPAQVVPTRMLEALLGWEGFRTIRRHFEEQIDEPAVDSSAPSGLSRHQRLNDALQYCVSHGILVPLEQVAARLRPRLLLSLREIAPLAFVSRDRPALLSRCLQSYLENATGFGRRTPFLVMDDSLDPSHIEENVATIDALRPRYGTDIEHFGPSEARSLRDALTRDGAFPPDVVDFCLFGESKLALGANRNRLLLRTVGRRLVMVDDDTVCELHSNGSAQDWAIETDDAREFWFCRDRKSARAVLPLAPVDFVDLYADALGQDPAALLSRAAASPTAATLKPVTLHRLLDDRARVRYVTAGLVGDCASWAPYYLTLRGASRARLARTETEYRAALGCREVAWSVPRHTVVSAGVCFGYALGLDNTALLPPFLPFGRNSDHLFAWTLGHCEPFAFRVDLPFAILHDPPPRSFGADASTAYAACRVSDVMWAVMCTHSPVPKYHDTGRRLRGMGQTLREMAELSPSDFDLALRDAVHLQLRTRLHSLDLLLSRYGGEPWYWANDVSRAITSLQLALSRPDPILPLDLLDGRSDTECRVALQRLVRLYGRLLVEWEEMRSLAASLYS